MTSTTWQIPKSRSVGLFTDLRLFYEGLELAHERGQISKELLEEELPQRLQKLLFVEKQSSRAARDLIRELRDFDWITPVTAHQRRPSDTSEFGLTPQGREVLLLFQSGQQREFLRALTTEMQELYTIPAWFVNRLWTINPNRQGEVVIPNPPRDWNATSRKWEDNNWTSDLASQTQRSLKIVNDVCPGSLPVSQSKWERLVQDAWYRLSHLKPRKPPLTEDEGGDASRAKYAPRRRLAFAMREAAVKYLFGNSPPDSQVEDFSTLRSPLAPRTYMGWCPRLESLELIFYTDAHPLIPGRLIFPTSVFRDFGKSSQFERVDDVKEPGGKSLWLHRPDWSLVKDRFLELLQREHQRVSTRVGTLYVSILDVRDELCRQMRISASCFDEYLEEALRESVLPGSKWSISVETDIREDQRSGPQLYRRPVWINGVPHSLIAITETKQVRAIA